jgi:23S rRNA (adenine2030-N6)-methyltransferase
LHGNNCYPGSAYIAKAILGEKSQLHLMEMHPQEYAALRRNMLGQGVNIHQRDGYVGTLAISPPSPRRGIVFIDPSYEQKTEYELMAGYIEKMHKKWPEAVIMLWYPILVSGLHENMKRQIISLNLPKLWHQEVVFNKNGRIGAMQGSGLICINTTFGVEAGLDEIQGWFN